MRLQTKWFVAVLSAGLSLAPLLSSSARAADEPPKPGAGDAAGGRGQGRRGAGGMLERLHTMVNSLDLTDQQKPTIETAFADAKTKTEAAVKEAGTERANIREKIKPIIDDLTQKVTAVLTDDQKAKLEKLRAEQRGPGGPGGRGNGPRTKPAN